MNSAYWNSGVESDKEIARKQKRKLQYFANILVIKDSANPQNEGKVMLYRFGKKIFDKCMEAMQPAFEDENPVNPFDFWEGADFKLKIRKVDGYWNYDKSEFDAPSPIFKNDDEIEAVWKKQYPLVEFSAETNFKSYDELKKRLDTVLAGTTTVGNVTTLMEDEPIVSTATVDTKEEPAPTPTVTENDEDDTMSYFEKLAEEG
tara:strand:- start:40 stop:648 length:609 start_codon:yes stop_codon:yes gene_type:complete